MKTLFVNARLATPFRLLHGYLLVEDDTIAGLGRDDPPKELLDEVEAVDLSGALLAPGFIDTHVHGGGGADVMDATVSALATIAAQHAAGGTTSFMPTTLCAPLEQLYEVFAAHWEFIDRQREDPAGARTLGLHLEGPYLNPLQAGALEPRSMRLPEERELGELLAPENRVRRMTVAPELPGGMQLGQQLRSHGCLASIGHSVVRGEGLLEALEHGYSLLTHFYSGMEGVTREHAYRVAGLVEGGYLHDDLTVEVIADGAHLPAELLRLINKVKGSTRIVLTTDAMRAAGLGPGSYLLGERQVLVEDGVAKLPDRSAFAGSVALANRLLRTMVEIAGVPLLEALKMLTINPARLLGIDDRVGRLAIGTRADLVVLAGDYSVLRTVSGGRTVYLAGRDEVSDASTSRR